MVLGQILPGHIPQDIYPLDNNTPNTGPFSAFFSYRGVLHAPINCDNDAFRMTCSLLMLVEDARCDHMEEVYSRAGLMTACR